jgi:TPR repeat protein
VSDLYDPNQSRLRVAHRHLSENDRLYRISLVVAPIALVMVLTTGTLTFLWHTAAPLPPPAAPLQPPAPLPSAPPGQPPAPSVNLEELRDRATRDTAALEDLRRRASAGNAEAQFYFATLYDPTMPSVQFANKDGATAAQWYERAAAQSYAMAENNLGGLYEVGQGRPKDAAQAGIWYRKAADQGDSTAQVNLGLLYENGRGVAKDEAEAARWYRKAADLGDASGAYDLGRMYENGTGVPSDLAEAVRWYRTAADADLADGQTALGRFYKLGQGVPKDIAEAARWFQKAADQNNNYAQAELGILFLNGEGVPRDVDRALALFRRAAANGDDLAVYQLGLCFDKGWGAPRNPLGAYIWYSIATSWGNPDSQSQAAAERDRLAREISPDIRAAAQRAAANWRPGSHGRIGVALQDLTPAGAQAIGTTQTRGAVITRVEDGSAGQRAGLAVQDVVTAVDGQPIANAAALNELIWLSVPGQIVGLWVEKARQRGSLQNIGVQLDQAPP